jgi:hypothetical protein
LAVRFTAAFFLAAVFFLAVVFRLAVVAIVHIAPDVPFPVTT